MEEYHTLADKAMEGLLATMEDLVESRGEADQEVDYHVREPVYALKIIDLCYVSLGLLERRAYTQSRPFWNVCHKQAAA